MKTREIYQGDALTILSTFPNEYVHCVVTSPPYWGLRDYGIEGQLGLEKTPEEYVAKMVEIFREVKRVLKKNGTLWLNLGDCYAGSGKGQMGNGSASDRRGAKQETNIGTLAGGLPVGNAGLKPKDLVGIPWRVAFALQADGWYLRSDIIWSKSNPMPESVRDRPTKAHEYVFLLTKNTKYYYDADAIKEKVGEPTRRQKTFRGGCYTNNATFNNNYDYSGHAPYSDAKSSLDGRNRRTVWNIATQPHSRAKFLCDYVGDDGKPYKVSADHFATFPEKLVEPCIKAGTSERGCCPRCGGPWVRVVDHKNMVIDRSSRTHDRGQTRSSGTMVEPSTTVTLGWQPSCSCGQEPVPCIVLDPFIGSGTTAVVAQKLGRDWIGIELKKEYINLARKRISLA